MRFLAQVAQRLYDRWGEGICDVTLLFPSRRARLFFIEELRALTPKPIWQPRMLSMEDIVADISQMHQGERLRLITELYKVYSEYHSDSFDGFYFWGEVLLADFNMVDKYLVDADELFSNVKDIKEIEADISYMSEEQLRIVAFWASLNDDGDISKEKRKFLAIWRSLSAIYHKFRARLDELGVAYSGMMQRRAAERIDGGEYSFSGEQHYAVIGFNALSECEKRILAAMQSAGVVSFFWDTDNYYTCDKMQEAGLFLRDNCIRFPQSELTSRDNFLRDKEFTAVAAASSALQCKYAAKIIEELSREGVVDKDTAIILTDENLLQPLLSSLPESCDKVNVTMGYPIRGSLAYSFIERLLELQSHARRAQGGAVSFYHADVVGIVTHPLIRPLEREHSSAVVKEVDTERLIRVDEALLQRSPLLSEIFNYAPSWQGQSSYLQRVIAALLGRESAEESEQNIEFLAYILNHIVALENSIKECDIASGVSLGVYTSLLRKQLQMLRIPFEGEPLEGVQIMGILESRNLDFRNVIILSMSDDNFPGNKLLQPSYIPYSLRVGHHLPTPEEHEGVFAYYFYRLLQRAQRVWMLYCSRSDEKSTGEQSRYIRQIEYETPFTVKRVEVSIDVNSEPQLPMLVEKRGKVAEQLAAFTREEAPQKLSPTALCRYIACPMRFYLHSLSRIRPPEEITPEIDAPMFGSILHHAMELLYTPLVGSTSLSEELPKLLQGSTIAHSVDRAIEQEYYKGHATVSSAQQGGSMILVREVVQRYMRTIVKYDMQNPSQCIRAVEGEMEVELALSRGKRVVIRGFADRVDIDPQGRVRVIDYKTGTPHLEFKSLEALFYGEGRERLSNIIQTLLYASMLKGGECREVTPTLYYLREMNREEYSPLLIDKSRKGAIQGVSSHMEEFMEYMQSTIDELFNPDIPFTQCSDVKSCEYCDYRTLCQR